MNDPISATIAERGKTYGDPALSHHNIGLAWTALIQQHYGHKLDHPLPDWLVELMMVSFKTQRSARVYHPDNYIDMAAYARFAENDQKKASEMPFVPLQPPDPSILDVIKGLGSTYPEVHGVIGGIIGAGYDKPAPEKPPYSRGFCCEIGCKCKLCEYERWEREMRQKQNA